MSSKTYTVPNISCGHCVATIEREVGAVLGVEDVKADAGSRQVTIYYSDAAVMPLVEETLKEIGYPAAS